MGIPVRSSVSRKMLGHCINSLAVESFHRLGYHFRYRLRVRSECPVLRNRIFLVCPHIRHRSKIHIKAKLCQIRSDRLARIIRLLTVPGCTNL